MKDLSSGELEKALGYKFKDLSLLELALTHTTFVFEHKQGHYLSNQRLEFIGDAVLDLIVGQEIYRLKPEADEGYLSKTRSIAVCEASFAAVARSLDVGSYLKLGKGEAMSNGADKDSTLADAFESIIAAIYFDSDIETVRKVILDKLSDTIKDAIDGKIYHDYKSRLLEIAQQKNNQHAVVFNVVDERGPAHQKEFEVECLADGELLAVAVGRSKKDAEQKAAKAAIEVYNTKFGV